MCVSIEWLQAVCEEGARKVYHLLQKKSIRTLGWQTLFNSLVVYDQQFRQFLQIPGAVLPVFQERDGRALEAYLGVLRRV
jgi:nuclear pore complex protein Nup205